MVQIEAKTLHTEKLLRNNTNIIIIDFYNIYCKIINFNINREFSFKTWKYVIEMIIKLSDKKTVFIISKPIFEVSQLEIINTLQDVKYKKLFYIIVNDDYRIKGQNRERDDFVCLLFHYITTKCKSGTVLISNDKYSNFNCIINKIKVFNLDIFNNKFNHKKLKFSKKTVNYFKNKIYKSKMKVLDSRTGFYYKK